MLVRVRRRLHRLGAPVLVIALLAPGAAVPARAQEGGGVIHGVIYQPDENDKLAGAKVTAVNVTTRKQYVSEVTSDNGSYEISGLPGGTYDLVIEQGGAVYVADNLVDLEQNQHLAVSYSIQPLRPANRRIAGMSFPKGSATPVGGFQGTSAAAAGTTSTRGFWTSPGGIILLVALAGGTAYAIDHNRNNNNASPSMP
jgi:hypothetical protein